MQTFKAANPGLSWEDLVASLPPDVSLNADGWYSPPENPNKQDFQYYVWGACVSEVELDVLTGMVNVLSSEIM
jgi:xanthine dehydrogenase molybdopterin-binding subunit B